MVQFAFSLLKMHMLGSIVFWGVPLFVLTFIKICCDV